MSVSVRFMSVSEIVDDGADGVRRPRPADAEKKQDEPTNSNALTKALVIVFGVTTRQRHLVRTRTKGLLSRTRVESRTLVSDGCQRRLSATRVNDSLYYPTLRDTALRYASYATLRYATLRYATLC